MPSKAAAGKLLETPGSRQKRIESIKLFLFIVPCLALVFVFHYMPLWGWIYAFFQYKPGMALANCKFVGFQNFTNLFGNPVMRQNLFRVLRNTLGIQFINYLLMPVPMLFAIFLSEIKSTRFQKCVQTLTTLPHFISWVIMFSLMSSLFGSSGLVNALMQKFGAEMTVNILTTDKHVWLIQALLYTWKNLGWNAIIYFAAITGLDQEVNEAAMIDGANRWQRIRYITIPLLMPTFFVLLIMSIGNFLNSGIDQFLAFSNALNKEYMQKARPTADDGTACYGTVLNNGSDSNFWACMTMWYRWQGYLENQLAYLLEADMVNGEYHSILDKDSLYYKGLKWYHEVYKRGLIDPDSINNDRPTQKVKVDGGYAQVPSGYLPGWAPTYLEYHIPGVKSYYSANSTYGDPRYMIGISAKTKNLDACLAYLDVLADPEAFLILTQGPDGEYWASDDKGNAALTDRAKEWLNSGHNDFTGFEMSTGETLELWNTPFIVMNGTLTQYGDGEGGYRCASTLGWSDVNEISAQSENFQKWQKTTGHENWKEWLGSDYCEKSPLKNVSSFTSLPDDNMQLMIDAIKDKVTTASWKMVYASSDSEFDALWDQMVADCNGLDANSIIEWRLADLENAKTIRDSL